MTIEILMATYNGEGFLREQLESLLAQTCVDWRLLARDDGSIDGTVRLLEQFQVCHPERIQIVRDTLGHLGATRNFARLLEISSGAYVMFCDQDDVWLPDKIQVSLEAMQAAEQANRGLPLVVHTDLIVTDSQLNQIADSFWRARRFHIDERDPLKSILHMNRVTGCTMLMNREAVDCSLPFPPQARLHDWWVALNVARKGKIISLPRPTMLYRQHQRNAIGARRVLLSPGRWVGQLRRFPGRMRRDYLTVKQVVPELSARRWCVKYVHALVDSQIHAISPRR